MVLYSSESGTTGIPVRKQRGFLAAVIRALLLKGEPIEASTDPGQIFWDDLTAANRLKIYLLSSGADVSPEVEGALSELTEKYVQTEETELIWKMTPEAPVGAPVPFGQ